MNSWSVYSWVLYVFLISIFVIVNIMNSKVSINFSNNCIFNLEFDLTYSSNLIYSNMIFNLIMFKQDSFYSKYILFLPPPYIISSYIGKQLIYYLIFMIKLRFYFNSLSGPSSIFFNKSELFIYLHSDLSRISFGSRIEIADFLRF